MGNKQLSRKNFIKLTALTGVALWPGVKAISQIAGLAGSALDLQAFRMTDNENLLNLDFYFIGVEPIDPIKKEIRKKGNNDSFMIVRLPQQHVAESYYLRPPENCDIPSPPFNPCTKDEEYQFQSRIAGYSYLVFQIYFELDAKKKNVESWTKPYSLNKKNLFNWNAPYLHLVVREDRAMTEPLFRKIANAQPLNWYPLGYQKKQGVYNFDTGSFPRYHEQPEKISKNNPFPITAIEAPYRLILSPELPDHGYKFKWSFSKNNRVGQGNELWMATLEAIKRPLDKKQQEELKQEKAKEVSQKGKPKYEDATNKKAATKEPTEEVEKLLPMELTMIGSPDHESEEAASTPADAFDKDSLPTNNDRHQLVELYFLNQQLLKSKARKLAFTPLGICGSIEFKNVLLEKINRYDKSLDLFEWKQSMSFGRDQEVQVVNLVKIMVGCHTGTMLHVRTTKRRTEAGRAFLDYMEFLVPLEESKNMLLFNQEDSSAYTSEVYKSNHIYKSVRFATMAPKQILPLRQCHEAEKVLCNENEPGLTERMVRKRKDGEPDDIDRGENDKNILGFWAKSAKDQCVGEGLLEWDFIGTDWEGKESHQTSNLYLITSAMNASFKTDTKNFSLPDLVPLAKFRKNLEEEAATVEALEKTFEDNIRDIGINAAEWHQVYKQSEQYLLEKADWFRALLEKKYKEVDALLEAVFKRNEKWMGAKDEMEEKLRAFKVDLYKKIQEGKDELNELIRKLKVKAADLVKEGDETVKKVGESIFYMGTLPGKHLDVLLQGLAAPHKNHIIKEYEAVRVKMASFDDTIGQYLNTIPAKYKVREIFEEKFGDVKKIFCFLENVEGTARSRIKAYNNKISIAVHKVENGAEELKKKVQETLKDACEPVNKVIDEYYHKANREISTIKTEYYMLRSSIRSATLDAKNKAMDFFDYDGVRHSLFSLQGTVQKVNEAVQKEIPVRLAHYENYIKNQVDSEVMDIKKNAMQGFAKFQAESKEKIKGAMREIGNELGGLVNPELASDIMGYYHDAREIKKEITSGLQDVEKSINDQALELQNQLEGLKKDISSQLKGAGDDLRNEILGHVNGAKDELTRQFQNEKNKLVTFQKDLEQKVKEGKKEIEQGIENAKNELTGYFKSLEAKILGSIKLKDILHLDIETPKFNRTNKSLYYNFVTKKFKKVDIGILSFIPNDQTRLVCYFEKSLKETNKYLSQTRMENFIIGIFDGRLEVEFSQLEIISTPEVKSKTKVQIKDVRFKKELAFLQALSKNIKVPGTGITVNITPVGVEANYAFTFPGISGGAFTLTNLKFGVGVKIPFPFGGGPLQPIEATFGINKPDDKFVVAAGIFGGRGHFVLTTTPNYLKLIDCAIEFGGYFGLNLGIAKGEAYLMAGIRYVYERTPEGYTIMRFYAYVTCGGSLTVYGFITVSVCFIVCLTYEDYDGLSSLYGTASLSISVKIGFFEKSFTLTFTKRMMGTDSKSSEEAYHRMLKDPGTEQLADASYGETIDGIRFADHREVDEAPGKKNPLFSDKGWIEYCKSFYCCKN